MKPKTLILDSSGLLRDVSGRLYVEHIDSFVTGEAMTLNLLRLKSEGSVVHERLRRTFECFSD